MKKLTCLTLLILFGTFLGNAQEASAPAKIKKPAVTNSTAEAVTGKIGYVSDKKITVKAKGAEASTAFLIDAETKVTVNGEAKAVADLKKGWSASVTPNATNFPTAAVIAVTKAAGTAESPAKTEE
ncbi:MAG: hypothetical protein EBQ51_08555 [Verrucomicrobia bacterium]|nr:hypothetical protein [Pseudomonadota bacterium]NBS07052.1 hypothetical protein [Verrucomicrobiota bacterium]NBS79395.1 hypothetical protein [bacterium]NBS49656.1 hypothetical protein [Verrucomicrobiota bacterium]NBT24709.1 hypothetical protein [bacterium]